MLHVYVYVYVLMIEGKPIPTELKGEAAELRHQIELDDPSVTGTFIITSSHPSSPIFSFSFLFPLLRTTMVAIGRH
jgi:hypothetical protein